MFNPRASQLPHMEAMSQKDILKQYIIIPTDISLFLKITSLSTNYWTAHLEYHTFLELQRSLFLEFTLIPQMTKDKIPQVKILNQKMLFGVWFNFNQKQQKIAAASTFGFLQNHKFCVCLKAFLRRPQKFLLYAFEVN